MARTLYGFTGGDVQAQLSSDGDYEPAVASLTAWDSRTGGTQLTDLLTVGGSAITTVTPDGLGRVLFQGPDGYTAGVWLEDAAGARWLVNPIDLASRATGGGVSTYAEIQALGDYPATFPAATHTHPATSISDSTTTGRAVLTAASTSAAQDAIGAGATGKAVLTAATALAGRTALDVYSKAEAAPAVHTHTAAAVSGLATVATTGAFDDLTGLRDYATCDYNITTGWPTRPNARVVRYRFGTLDTPPLDRQPGDEWALPSSAMP